MAEEKPDLKELCERFNTELHSEGFQSALDTIKEASYIDHSLGEFADQSVANLELSQMAPLVAFCERSRIAIGGVTQTLLGAKRRLDDGRDIPDELIEDLKELADEDVKDLEAFGNSAEAEVAVISDHLKGDKAPKPDDVLEAITKVKQLAHEMREQIQKL